MLQDIEPHVYKNEMRFEPPASGDRAVLCGSAGAALREENGMLALPAVEDFPPDTRWIYGFSIDGGRYYLPLEGAALPEGYGWRASARYRQSGPGDVVFACAVGESLTRWYRSSRFCGACGGRTEPGTAERSLVCTRCGQVRYPKICPAVIVAVTHGERLLLTRYAGRSFTRYALVAGFNEIGESIEATVRREVLEETGLRVGRLRFYKSQPWVVTDSLLMGFFAELEGPDRIVRQESELAEARWFDRAELPADHSGDSLTGEMIELFRADGLDSGAAVR